MLGNKKSLLCGPEIIRNPEKQKVDGIRLEEETKLNSVRKWPLKRVGVTSGYSKFRVTRY